MFLFNFIHTGCINCLSALSMNIGKNVVIRRVKNIKDYIM